MKKNRPDDRMINVLEANKFYFGQKGIEELQRNGMLGCGCIAINIYLFKDKNGKNIYEDDFVKDKDGNIYYITSILYRDQKYGERQKNDSENINFANKVDKFLKSNNIKILSAENGRTSKAKDMGLEFIYSVWDKYEIAPKMRISFGNQTKKKG